MKTNTLYRFYDASHRLLYVGITLNPVARIRQHRQDKAWWVDVADIKMQQFASRADLEQAERIAIREENPKWNVIFARREIEQAKASRPKSRDPNWLCHWCADGEGFWLFLSQVENLAADKCRKWWRRLECETTESSWKPIDVGLLMSAPEEGRWTVLCQRCCCRTSDNEPLGNVAYLIELNRADTWQKLMGWTIHLMEKNWFPYTNWSQIMRNAGAKE